MRRATTNDGRVAVCETPHAPLKSGGRCALAGEGALKQPARSRGRIGFGASAATGSVLAAPTQSHLGWRTPAYHKPTHASRARRRARGRSAPARALGLCGGRSPRAPARAPKAHLVAKPLPAPPSREHTYLTGR